MTLGVLSGNEFPGNLQRLHRQIKDFVTPSPRPSARNGNAAERSSGLGAPVAVSRIVPFSTYPKNPLADEFTAHRHHPAGAWA